MECPICYDKIKYSAIGSCTHHFCIKCIIDWCKNGGEKCPVCKFPIEVIRRDIEFDSLNGSNNIELESLLPNIRITFLKDKEAGITLENNYSLTNFGRRLPGVKIIKIDKNKWSYKCGLRFGDIILFINKIPCITHKQVIEIIDNAVLSNSTVNLIINK